MQELLQLPSWRWSRILLIGDNQSICQAIAGTFAARMGVDLYDPAEPSAILHTLIIVGMRFPGKLLAPVLWEPRGFNMQADGLAVEGARGNEAALCDDAVQLDWIRCMAQGTETLAMCSFDGSYSPEAAGAGGIIELVVKGSTDRKTLVSFSQRVIATGSDHSEQMAARVLAQLLLDVQMAISQARVTRPV